jgi:hypothetical protein
VISLANKNSGAAYPSVAITANTEALGGLKQFLEALTVCADAMRIAEQYHSRWRLYQFLRRERIF